MPGQGERHRQADIAEPDNRETPFLPCRAPPTAEAAIGSLPVMWFFTILVPSSCNDFRSLYIVAMPGRGRSTVAQPSLRATRASSLRNACTPSVYQMTVLAAKVTMLACAAIADHSPYFNYPYTATMRTTVLAGRIAERSFSWSDRSASIASRCSTISTLARAARRAIVLPADLADGRRCDRHSHPAAVRPLS
jgi:hypothetical protein